MNLHLLKVSICALAVSFTAFAADTVTKEATGEASFTGAGNSEEKAFEEAKKQALRSAVEQAAGVMIQADTLTLNSQLVSDRVFAQAAGYVKKYDVVSKKKEKSTIVVTIKAEVGTVELDKDLQAVRGIVTRLGRSKLIIVLQENSIDLRGSVIKSENLATALTDTFKKDGWKIIDEKGTGGGAEKFKLSAGVAGSTVDPKEIGKASDADYILYGTVNFRYQEKPAMMKDADVFFVTGEYDLAMFEVRSGAQLTKVAGKFDQKEIQKVNTLTSYERTAHDLCRRDAPRIVAELRNPVLEYLRNQDVNGASVTMKVSGLGDLDSVDAFQKSVATVKNVKDVKPAGDFEDGKMTYTVSIQGSAMDLGKALDKTSFKKKKISVKSVHNNEVEVAIAK